MLKRYSNQIVAGCDEAGRGCLAGPVFAAAVILPQDYQNEILNDSKVLSLAKRNKLRKEIESIAIAWSVARISPAKIDKINILNASFLAMHKALAKLSITPEILIIDEVSMLTPETFELIERIASACKRTVRKNQTIQTSKKA